MTAQLLIVAGMPLCAMVAGVILWWMHRDESLEDTELLRNFLVVFAICFGLGVAVLRTDSVRMRWDTAFRIRKEIEGNALWTTINGFDESGTGTALRQSLEQQMFAGASLKEALARSRPILAEAAQYRLGFADQQTHILWARYTTDTLKELQQRDPDSCYLMISAPTEVHGDTLSAENNEAFHAALIRLFESADQRMRREQSPTDVPSDFNAAGREFAAITKELTERYGSEVAEALASRKFENPPGSEATMCKARIYQLETILKRPQGLAAMLVDNALR